MPHVTTLDNLLRDWILASHSPAEEDAVLRLLLRCKRLLAVSRDPDALAERMVRLLRADRQQLRAA